MKKTSIGIVLCTVLALCFYGCVVVNFTGAGSVSGKGAPEKFDITVGEYNGIKVEGFCEIQYYAASSNTVTLEVQPNLREYFVVEVINSELIVRTTKRIGYSGKTPVLTVSTPVLNRLSIEGACSFKANDRIKASSFDLKLSGAGSGEAELDVTSLKVSMSGAGSFGLSGRADTAEFNMSGAGELKASSLEAREASVNLSGAGKIRVNCSEKLSIDANGAGTVEYRGSPSLSVNKSGAVSVRKVD